MIAEEVDDERTKETADKNSSSSRNQKFRSTGPVDRPQYQKFGRPARSTDVHNMHGDGARSTARSTDRSTGGRGRSTARSTDKRVRVVIAGLETCLYLKAVTIF